ncbi:MAG: YidC/Oxa1 family membrane protein insertase [Patescibacteria group bacterium]|nr:YidC/Oxa1 family membrane protein insertase [Patescibacteria group bacterium]
MGNLANFTINPDSWITKILYQPLFNVLMLFYVYIPGNDLGIAIIALTLLIRLILFPSYLKTLKAQQALKEIQPQIKEIQEKYKNDQAQQSKELMKVYQDNKVNPLGSCLPMLIQLPILYALYRVFVFGLNADSLTLLYTWFPKVPEVVDTHFLSFLGNPSLVIDLAVPSLLLAIIAGVGQLFQSWLLFKSNTTGQEQGVAKMVSTQMIYIFPVITVLISMNLPAALALYWAATAIFTALQQLLILRVKTKPEPKTESTNNS